MRCGRVALRAAAPAHLPSLGRAPRPANAIGLADMTSALTSAQPQAPSGARTSVRTEHLRALVLGVLAATPCGLTADEIAAKLDESVLAVRPRVSELFHARLIEKTGGASGEWRRP